jgi:glycosyltransferase involved in cell wall biosynthesis
MNVLIYTESFDLDKRYLEYYLARELSRYGNNVTVISYNNKFLKQKMDGFEIIFLSSLLLVIGFNIPSFRSIVFLINFLKKNRVDIAHLQPLISPLSMILIIFSVIYKYKIVGTIFSQMPNLNSSYKKTLLFFEKILLEFFFLKRISKIFVKSDELMKIQTSFYNIPRDKFHVIPLGADHRFFIYSNADRIKIRKLFNLYVEDIVIIYTGKINREKRVDFLISALEPLIKINSRVKLVIVGKGTLSYETKIKKLITEKGLENNMIIYPPFPLEYLPKLFSASDIAVWPGLSSISIIEAASVGLPIVIERSPVEVYGVEENGFTFSPGNIEDLRKCLKILIENSKLRKEMGIKSRMLVENKLNWEIISRRYEDIYLKCLYI